MSFAASFTKYTSKHSAKAAIPPDSGCIDESEYVENVSVAGYIITKELGSGSTAKVVLAFDKETQRRVAIKIVKRKSKDEDLETSNSETDIKSRNMKNSSNSKPGMSGFTDNRIYREIVISSLLDHPHIVKLLDFFYSNSHFFLVFEYVKGKQLYDVISKSCRIPEDKARKYFRQLLSALDYIHKNSLVHRDLKIENIMIDQNDNVKIIDFGLSNFYDNKRFLQTFCGSLYFAAPELLMGKSYNGPEVDVWSLGVVLYVMLCGKVPFDDESVRDLQNKIKEANYILTVPLSPSATDLLSKILVSDSSIRLTVTEILKSEWVNCQYKIPVENYIGNRFPINQINFEYVKALSTALSFQFSTVKEDLENYLMLCKDHSSSKNTIYWSKSPTISLYYLLMENINSYSKVKPNTLSFDCTFQDSPESLHKFVRFVFSSNDTARPSKFFSREIFESKNAEQISEKASEPIFKTSYIKGIFQGIRIKHIGSKGAIKRILIDIFKKNAVSYEVDENGYYCSYSDKKEECYFKVSLYYNVLLSDYYLILKCLNNKKDSFKAVYNTIQNSLKYTS